MGQHASIDLPTGEKVELVMLNNAATTPPFEYTLKKVIEFLSEYGTFHRGSGPFATKTYERVNSSIKVIRKFFGVSSKHELIFTKNTSDAINLFIRLLNLKEKDIIITSEIEHTSNNLPWTYNSKAQVIQIRASGDGVLDYDDLEEKIHVHGSRVKLIALTGASNLTGYIPDISKISMLAKKYKALLFIDAAQLAPHRPINMKLANIDTLALSAHKIYAPFGIGVLVVPKKILERAPVDPGGGSIDMLSKDSIVWAPSSTRHQAGTWNVTGIIALAASCEVIASYGWDKVISHEKNLIKSLIKSLYNIPKINVYIPADKYLKEERIGTFVFNIEGYHHSLVSAILENEYGIETRAGTICNHHLVRNWIKVTDQEQKEIERSIKTGNRLATYGIVRVSLGVQNSKNDIQRLINALHKIVTKGPNLSYIPVKEEEIYVVDKSQVRT